MGEYKQEATSSIHSFDYLKALDPRIRNFEVDDKDDDGNVIGKIQVYDADKVMEKLAAFPKYVAEAMQQRFTDETTQLEYDKIVLDKWGRKSADTKRFVESPEMVFYRTSMLIAEGLVKDNPSLDYEQTARMMFGKFVDREVFPNTPFMANGGHKIVSKYLEDRISEQDMSTSLKNELTQESRINEQLFACFVLDIYDSRTSIFKTMNEAADIQAAIGGTGFNFSNLRPGNETIHGTGGLTDGPIAFMSMFSHVLGKTMNQGGKREGANMFELDWNHPDIMRFLYAKREDGEISAANVSVTVDHEFMDAYKSDGEERFYPLKNPHYNPEKRPHIPEHYSEDQLKQALGVTKMNKKAKTSMLLGDDGVTVLSPWLHEGLDEEYRIIGKIKNGTVYLDAKKVMKHLAFNSWYNGEPGIISTGHINDHNPTHPTHFRDFLLEQKDPEAIEIVSKLRKENPEIALEGLIDAYINEKDDMGRYINLPRGVGLIRSTNPCGEKPLLGYEACVLGHINLEKILNIDSSVQSGYSVDRNKFKELTVLMYNILDDAIDQNQFTIPEIEKTQKSNRKIGVGFMGMANMLYKLELPYNSEKTREFIDDLLEFWEEVSDEASFERGERLGTFPNFKYSHHRNGRPKRNAIVRTLAPTGTTGFAAQTTGGMEPEYALAYTRTTVQGTSIDMFNPILEEKLHKYNPFAHVEEKNDLHRFIINEGRGSLQGFDIKRIEGESEDSFIKRKRNLDKIKSIFVTTYDISAEDHIQMEAVVQRHVDDAISKTTNFRNNATLEDVEKAFVLAYDLGIKGVTFYRDGTRKGQPLKVKGGKEEDIKERSDLADVVIKRLESSRPEIVGGLTEKVSTPFGYNAFVTLNWERDPETGEDRSTYESFVTLGESGGDLDAIGDGYGKLLSLALKAGVPAYHIAEQLKGIGGTTQIGVGENKIKSLPDAIAKGLQKAIEKEEKITGKKNNGSSNGLKQKSANLCPKCSKQLIITESCEKCSCGYARC